MITAERFAKGRTFEDYVTYAGSAENLAREAFGGAYLPDGGSIGLGISPSRTIRLSPRMVDGNGRGSADNSARV